MGEENHVLPFFPNSAKILKSLVLIKGATVWVIARRHKRSRRTCGHSYKRRKMRFTKEEAKIQKYCATSDLLTLHPNYIAFY